MTTTPDPADDAAMAALSDEEQVALIAQTDNSPDPDVEQPPQDPSWQPDPADVEASI